MIKPPTHPARCIARGSPSSPAPRAVFARFEMQLESEAVPGGVPLNPGPRRRFESDLLAVGERSPDTSEGWSIFLSRCTHTQKCVVAEKGRKTEPVHTRLSRGNQIKTTPELPQEVTPPSPGITTFAAPLCAPRCADRCRARRRPGVMPAKGHAYYGRTTSSKLICTFEHKKAAVQRMAKEIADIASARRGGLAQELATIIEKSATGRNVSTHHGAANPATRAAGA